MEVAPANIVIVGLLRELLTFFLQIVSTLQARPIERRALAIASAMLVAGRRFLDGYSPLPEGVEVATHESSSKARGSAEHSS